jgi:hypothetical protein
MKKLFYILLFFSFLSYSQSVTTLNFKTKKLNTFNPISRISFKPALVVFNFNQDSFISKKHSLSVYNSFTNLNDNYTIVSDKYYMNNVKTLSFYNFNQSRIDSFNPGGADDFKGALLVGVFNLLFNN